MTCHPSSRRLVFDLETNGLLPELDRVHTLTIEDPDTGDTWSCTDSSPDDYTPISEGLDILSGADVIIGHNILGFDIPALAKVYPDWSPGDALLRDTIIMSRLIWPDTTDLDQALVAKGRLPKKLMKSHGLKAWGYRLGVMKDDYDGGWEEWNPSMQSYGEQDARVTAHLFRKVEAQGFPERSIQLEHDFAQIMLEQERMGFPFDVDAATALHAELAQRRTDLETRLIDTFGSWWNAVPREHKKTVCRQNTAFPKAEFRRVSEKTGKELKPEIRHPFERCQAGGKWTAISRVTFNPGSRDHIAQRLKVRYGWEPPEVTPTGLPKIDEKTLASAADVIPEARDLVEHLTIKKLEGYLTEGANAWLRLVQEDDDGVSRLHGRVTTNGAVTGRCTHSRPNVAQVPSVDKPWGKECRSLFWSGPGYVVVGADASGLELRCLAHYLHRWDNGRYRDQLLNGDVHQMMADAIGLTRSNAKTFTYAYLYGAGDKKLGAIVDPLGSARSQSKAGKSLRKTAEANVPGLGRLQQAVQHRVKTSGQLKGLDGRLMHVRSPHSALNTLLQGAGAIIMKEATVLFHTIARDEIGLVHGDDFRQMAHVHDELQVSARPEGAEQVGQALVEAMQRTTDTLSLRCPIDGEYKIGPTWADTH